MYVIKEKNCLPNIVHANITKHRRGRKKKYSIIDYNVYRKRVVCTVVIVYCCKTIKKTFYSVELKKIKTHFNKYTSKRRTDDISRTDFERVIPSQTRTRFEMKCSFSNRSTFFVLHDFVWSILFKFETFKSKSQVNWLTLTIRYVYYGKPVRNFFRKSSIFCQSLCMRRGIDTVLKRSPRRIVCLDHR